MESSLVQNDGFPQVGRVASTSKRCYSTNFSYMSIRYQSQLKQCLKNVFLDSFFATTSLCCEPIIWFSLILNLYRNMALTVSENTSSKFQLCC